MKGIAEELGEHVARIAHLTAVAGGTAGPVIALHVRAIHALLPEVRKLERLADELVAELQEELTLRDRVAAPPGTPGAAVIAFPRRPGIRRDGPPPAGAA